jgi:hypothetical protein
MVPKNSDSVAVMRFAVEASDDGAAQRSGLPAVYEPPMSAPTSAEIVLRKAGSMCISGTNSITHFSKEVWKS